MNKKMFKSFVPVFIKKLYRGVWNLIFSLNCYLRRSIKTHTFAGIPLKIYIFDPVSKQWYDHDENRNEIQFLQRNKLRTGAKVFNIGAHHAVIALLFSKIVGEKGKVVAVEMDYKHVKVAKINKEANNASNLNIVHAAISNKDGYIFFNKDQVLFDLKRGLGRNVRAISVDHLYSKFGMPDVLYIDVEGYECKVLEGAKKTLKTYPDIFIEVHVKNGLENFDGTVEDIISYLPSDKYNIYMAPAVDNCTFRALNMKSDLIKDRFYLIALAK